MGTFHLDPLDDTSAGFPTFQTVRNGSAARGHHVAQFLQAYYQLLARKTLWLAPPASLSSSVFVGSQTLNYKHAVRRLPYQQTLLVSLYYRTNSLSDPGDTIKLTVTTDEGSATDTTQPTYSLASLKPSVVDVQVPFGAGDPTDWDQSDAQDVDIAVIYTADHASASLVVYSVNVRVMTPGLGQTITI